MKAKKNERVQNNSVRSTELAAPVIDLPVFRAGDSVRVHYKIIEGDKHRIQPFEGIVIAQKGVGVTRTFTVRRIGADGVGVERIFPCKSPNISKLEILARGKVRRAKLYYMRGRVGKEASKIKALHTQAQLKVEAKAQAKIAAIA